MVASSRLFLQRASLDHFRAGAGAGAGRARGEPRRGRAAGPFWTPVWRGACDGGSPALRARPAHAFLQRGRRHAGGRRRLLRDRARAETLGIVGESGCGKSVTALSVLRLLHAKLGRTVGGSISFEGRNLLDVPEDEMRTVRGNAIAMIFQEPMTSLNPVLTVGHQIAESIGSSGQDEGGGEEPRRRHAGAGERSPTPGSAWTTSSPVLRRDAQRVMIAMALACNPRPAGGRRADDGAGRHDPGADPQADA